MTWDQQFRRQGLGVAIACLAAIVAMLIFPSVLAPAYLAGWVLAATVPLGSMAMLMVAHCTGGRWTDFIRPYFEAACALTPLLVVASIPLALVSTRLYFWADPKLEVPAYFHLPWIIVRALLALALWGLGGPWLSAASRAVPFGQRAARPLRVACCIGLPLYVLSVSWAFTDWAQSFERHWHSSVFGFIIITSQALTAMAWSIANASLSLLRRRARADQRLRDVGNLLLASTLLHAYVSFSQFFIIWNGNIPERTKWYIDRTRGFWLFILLTLVVTQFALPFGSMLFRRLKQSPRYMIALCSIVLLGGLLESAWLVVPPNDDNLWTIALVPLFALVLFATAAPWRLLLPSAIIPYPPEEQRV